MSAAAAIVAGMSFAGCGRQDVERQDGQRQDVALDSPLELSFEAPVAPVVDPLSAFRNQWDSEADFAWPVTIKLAEMCRDGYLSTPAEMEAAYKSIGFKEVVTIEGGALSVRVATEGDLAVAVFDAKELRDVDGCVASLGLSTTLVKDGQVHEGFWKMCGEVREELAPLLRGKSTIWLTGHSGGGALAACCAYDLERNETIRPTGVITFGQPLFADKELATYMDTNFLGRYATVVHREDIVPRIPPTFKPCGRLVWIKEDKVYRSAPWVLPYTVSVDRGRPTGPLAEIKPLSKEEFEERKAAVKRESEGAEGNRAADEGKPDEAAETPDDHSIIRYADEVRRVLGG